MVQTQPDTTKPDTAEPGTTQPGTHFFIAAIALAVTIWPIGFNLGAFGTIFFDRLLEIWAISIAALLAGLLVDRGRDQDVLSRTDQILLALPSLWLLTTMLHFEEGGGLMRVLNDALMFMTAFFSVPHIIRIVMPIAMPEVMAVRGRRQTLNLLVLTVAIAVASFAIGYRNDLFMTCEDFKVSGNDLPTNCRPTDTRYERGTFRLPQ
ncbi:hypothetical protein [Paracoccus sp. S1E-3]|uniref:hypothetical protein n=1 Tax=Paracoccus sp. S1E-3 TaxID=2756130 RepID=UPI0015EF90F0|nr:hypothetical protein [Paracoccus sp. S1E-3]MBA4492589.1 hypothetical protein [Paracoccus sp. S1E-3]